MTIKRTPITCEHLAKMPAGTIVYDNSGASGIKLTFSHATDDNIFFSDQEKPDYDVEEGQGIPFFREGEDFYLPNTDEPA